MILSPSLILFPGTLAVWCRLSLHYINAFIVQSREILLVENKCAFPYQSYYFLGHFWGGLITTNCSLGLWFCAQWKHVSLFSSLGEIVGEHLASHQCLMVTRAVCAAVFFWSISTAAEHVRVAAARGLLARNATV